MAIKNDELGGIDWVNGDVLDADDLNDTFDATISDGLLGEVRMFALSITGALTKANLQDRGWAICDGTTPNSQGISDADITASTPDLQEKFIRMSDDETSGTTGGSDTHTLTTDELPSHRHSLSMCNSPYYSGSGNKPASDNTSVTNTGYTNYTGGGSAHNNIPAYYELAFFLKVKTAVSGY